MSDLFQEEIPNQTQDRLKVLVPFPVDKAYDYATPKDVNVGVGDYVSVPLSNRGTYGVVWGDGDGELPSAKVKAMRDVYQLPPMPKEHREFINWVAQYTCSALGSVLKMALSAPSAFETPKPTIAYELNAHGLEKLSVKQNQVLEIAKDGVATLPKKPA